MGPSRVPYTSSGPGGQYHPFGILGRLFRSFACYWLGVAAQLRSHLDSHLATALAACVAFGVVWGGTAGAARARAPSIGL
eukprot:scaffold152546_cov31-Tisochrysis_lutea.AAC.1